MSDRNAPLATALNNEVNFYRYPPVGPEDWRYAYPTAKVRVLELAMISHRQFGCRFGPDRTNAAGLSFTNTASVCGFDAG
ncbi:MAG: hypothetical protein ACYSTO_08805 [Planctomycetota bacterium]